MGTTALTFEPDLRISPRWVILILAVLGWALAFVSEFLSEPAKVAMLALFLILLSAIAWMLDGRNTHTGQWFTIIALVVMVLLVNGWMGLPGSLTWLAIPTGLATALIGPPAAVGMALGETVLLLLLPTVAAQFFSTPLGAASADPAATGVALGAIWATLGVMVAAHYPAYQVAWQSQAYCQRAQGLLEEARSRKAELAQALDDLVHANRQLALANERITAWRLVAEEAQKAKTMFVAKVSHEFRTPLNMIIGLVSLMIETPKIYAVALSPEMRQDLKIVHRNCEHLARMINDVLNLTQMEAGRLVLHRERVDLREIVDSAVESVLPLVEKKGLFLQVEIPDSLPQVYCDRTRIQQVILNLVSNATRFTEKGGITLRVAGQAQYVVVSVTDTGPGISPEDADRIFEPFCQGTSGLWRDTGGGGLGLTISKQFVERHGGRIWLESQSGVGATFSFSLPISGPIPPIARPGHWIKEDWIWAERKSSVGFPNSHYRPRVVVCDETGGLYPEFVRYSDEIEFVDSQDWDHAVRELQQCPAHVLVLNAAVPNRLLQLVEIARREAPGTPIVGCSVPQAAERTFEAGALGYLIKPVRRADLEEAIQAVGKPVRRVLVVDDDLDVLRLFTRMLHTCDDTLSVATASSGQQALDELRRNQPDLVLLDILMPDMDGWQVLERLRQDKGTAELPVMLVSAQDPADQPPESTLLLTTISEGLSISKVLRCSLALAELLLTPEAELDRAPRQIAETGQALTGRGRPPENRPGLLL